MSKLTQAAPHIGIDVALAAEYPLLGIGRTVHRNTRGKPLSFQTMPFLIELFRDFPKIDGADAVKAVQTGWSELMVAFTQERSGWLGRHVTYVLPKGRGRDDFVKTRVEPLHRSVPEYRERVGGEIQDGETEAQGATNVRIKHFGAGTQRYLGAGVSDEFVEFSTDVLIVDEYDECVNAGGEKNLALAENRLRASPYPQLFRLGNPTRPGWGISKLYDEGDGRRWHWRCSGCGHKQVLQWDIHIVERADTGAWVARDKQRANDPALGDIRPVCIGCRNPFDRVIPGAAWVAARPTNTRRSYTMSRLDVLSQSIRALIDEWNKKQGSIEGIIQFRRGVLGEAVDAEGYSVTPGMLSRCAVGPPNDLVGGDAYNSRTVVAGIDVGKVLNVFIDVIEKQGAKVTRRSAYVAAVTSFDLVWDILQKYKVSMAVFDAGPERTKCQEIRDKARNKGGKLVVWLCQFHPTAKSGEEKYAMRLDRAGRIVTVDRTQLLDTTYDEIVAGERIFPSDIESLDGFVRQMQAPVRTLSPKQDRFIWTEGSAPDHYFLANAYARVAYDLLNRGARFIVVSDRPEAESDEE